jgi:tetratricopeptide (TPR) repeat protein/predicted O-methyltransferase YrrM
MFVQSRETQNADDFLQKGDRLRQQENYAEALEAYFATINLEPNSYKGHYHLGLTFFLQGNHWEAEKYYKKAIELNPEAWESYHNLGDLNQKRQDLGAAIYYYQQAIPRNANSYWSYNNLGKVLQKQGELDKAIECYQKALEIAPNFAVAKENLEASLFKQNLGQSIAQYQQQIEENPKSDRAYCNLGDAFNHQKNFAEAIACYQRAIELKPQEPIYYQRLGNVFAKTGESSQSIPCIRKLHELRNWQESLDKQYEFTIDWFTNNLPTWEKYLLPFADRNNLNIVEIGSFEGMSTCWLLDRVLTHDTARITCIDMFVPPSSWGDGNNYENLFDANISKTGTAYKVDKRKGTSSEQLRQLHFDTYDIVYIDGSHWATDVIEDAVLTFKLVKTNGIIIFDDYTLTITEKPEQSPRFAIDAFVSLFSSKVKVLSKTHQLILKKISN